MGGRCFRGRQSVSVQRPRHDGLQRGGGNGVSGAQRLRAQRPGCEERARSQGETHHLQDRRLRTGPQDDAGEHLRRTPGRQVPHQVDCARGCHQKRFHHQVRCVELRNPLL